MNVINHNTKLECELNANFFKYGEKTLRFQKHPDTCGQGLISQIDALV